MLGNLRKQKIIIGLAGRIGCGKSTLCEGLAKRYNGDNYGMAYVDTDDMYRYVFANDPVVRLQMADRVCPLEMHDQRIRMIVENPKVLDTIAEIVNEPVLMECIRRIALSHAPVVVLSSALLPTSFSLEALCGIKWQIKCNTSLRKERFMSRNYHPLNSELFDVLDARQRDWVEPDIIIRNEHGQDEMLADAEMGFDRLLRQLM